MSASNCRLFVLIFCLASFACLAVDQSIQAKSRNPLSSSRTCYRFVSSDSVASLGGTFFGSFVKPLPTICYGPTGTCDLYINPISCLGWNGPIGAVGPLGSLGPLSHEIASPNGVVKIMQDFVKQVMGGSSLDGIKFFMVNRTENPLSRAGPLGDAYFNVMPSLGDFTKHMQGLGVWSILGPIGPLGALGPLGPLGPMGIHNYQKNSNGDYIDSKGKIQKSLKVAWDSKTTIEWPLFEDYSKSRALELSKLGQLDSSFMVSSIGSLTPDVYSISISEPQYITILVTPAIYGKNFIIEVREKKSQHLVASTGKSSYAYTPFIQFLVGNDQLVGGVMQYEVSVSVDPIDCGVMSMVQCFMEYYLYVVGSTKQMLRSPSIDYSGPYIKNSCK